MVSDFGCSATGGLLAAESSGERDSRWLDARDLIVVSHGEMGPAVQWTESRENAARHFGEDVRGIVVVTGYLDRKEGLPPRTGLPAGAPLDAAAVLHGGEARLENAPEGGARATLRLPLEPSATGA